MAKENLKIAIIRRNRYGDVIAATVPLYNYLKEKYKEFEFHIFLQQSNVKIAKYFFTRKEDYLHIIPTKGNKYLNAILTALKYRSLKIDIGICPAPVYYKLNNMFMYLLGAQKIYGEISNKNSWLNKLITEKRNPPEDVIHIGLRTLKIFEPSVSDLRNYYPVINRNLIQKSPLLHHDNLSIVISVSNNRETSLLNNNKVALILNKLYKYFNFQVVITGITKDKNKADDLIGKLKESAIFVETPDYDDFVSLLSTCDMFMFGDGGAGHLAGALGLPGVALYGITSVVEWGILSDKVVHLFDKFDVNNIDDDEIINALLTVYDRYKKSNENNCLLN
jgi:ADP-heptose:LPS heptosyltransferase